MLAWLLCLECPVCNGQCSISRCGMIRNVQNAPDVVFGNRALQVLCKLACNACARPHCPLNIPVLWFASTLLTGDGPAVLGDTFNIVSSVSNLSRPRGRTSIMQLFIWLTKANSADPLPYIQPLHSHLSLCTVCHAPVSRYWFSVVSLDKGFLHDSVFRAFVP